MRTIWKFGEDQPIGKIFAIEMPAGATVLAVGMDSHTPNPAFWAYVDTEEPLEERHFAWLATGSNIPHGMEYQGSANCGHFIWHLFDF